MHMHGITANMDFDSMEAANAMQRSVTAQEAVNVRKELVKTASQMEGESDFKVLLQHGGEDKGEQREESATEEEPAQNKSQDDSDGEEHTSYWA